MNYSIVWSFYCNFHSPFCRKYIREVSKRMKHLVSYALSFSKHKWTSYFFSNQKIDGKTYRQIHIHISIFWEIPQKCTCLGPLASFYKNILRSYYILREVLCGSALLLTPWEAKCGAFALGQGTQEKKLMLVWVSLQGPVLAQVLAVGGWEQAQPVPRLLPLFP